MSKQIKILLVDDHEVVRMGLRTLLERRENIAVVGEAGTVEEAVAAAERTEPDVIVMDIRLPDGSGVDACREIRGQRPETKVIMLTSYADDEAIYGSIMAGASGYMLKQTRGQDLASAIGRVAAGESSLHRDLVNPFLEFRGELETDVVVIVTGSDLRWDLVPVENLVTRHDSLPG